MKPDQPAINRMGFDGRMNGLLHSLDPKTLASFSEFLGRDPHPTGAGRDVMHIRAANFPHMRFEWHPKKRIVYLVRVGATPEIGEAMAFNIETHGDAHNAVLIWLRGYREGQAPGPKPHLQI